MGAAYEPVKTMLIASSIKDPQKPEKILGAKHYTLNLAHVSFQYPDAAKGQLAINDFTLTIKPGEKIGVVGYSGSGKSTLTKLLLRFMDVGEGSIDINEIDVRHVKQADLRALVSYVPQEPLLFHRSIRENIAYTKPDVTSSEIERVAAHAYVDEFAKAFPDSY